MSSIYDNTKDFSSGSVVDFQRAATLMDAAFGYYDLDLSVARTNVILDISGDFLFADLSTNGVATIELNNQMDAPEAPIMFAAGLAINNVPFKQLKITNSAQAGAKMRLLYSTGRSIVPSASMANINQIIQPVNINDSVSSICHHIRNGNTNVPAGANQIVTLADPSVNTNGFLLRAFALSVVPPANSWYEGTLMAASVAPNSNNSQLHATMLQYINISNTTVAQTVGDFDNFRKIPPGWGIWLVESTAVVGANRIAMFDYEAL